MRGFRPAGAVTMFFLCGFFALLSLCGASARGEELLKGTIFFDPPAFLQAGPAIDGDPAAVACYLGRDNAPAKSFRVLTISKHPVGFDKAGKEHPVNEESLKKEMASFFNPWKTNGVNITHVSGVTSATVGRQRAVRITFDQPDPGYLKTGLCHCEHYWVQYESNMVIWIAISANSESGLKSLRESLSRVKIVKQMK